MEYSAIITLMPTILGTIQSIIQISKEAKALRFIDNDKLLYTSTTVAFSHNLYLLDLSTGRSKKLIANARNLFVAENGKKIIYEPGMHIWELLPAAALSSFISIFI